MKQRITLTLDEDLVEEIDEKRGDVPRSRFVERLLFGVWKKEKDGTLFEQIFNSGDVSFIDSEGNTYDTLEVDGIKHAPIFGDELTEGAVLLPSGLGSYKDEKTLIEEIKKHIHRYIEISPFFETIATYYVLLSWLYDEINMYSLYTIEKMKIFVGSTVKDLGDLRDELYRSLKELGHTPWFSEKDDFPTNRHPDSMTNCIRVAEECDLFVVLLDKRAGLPYTRREGSPYPDLFDLTISEAEYRCARKKGKPVCIFIRKRAEHESAIYRQIKDKEQRESTKWYSEPAVYEFYDRLMHEKPHIPWRYTFDSIREILGPLNTIIGEVQAISSVSYSLPIPPQPYLAHPYPLQKNGRFFDEFGARVSQVAAHEAEVLPPSRQDKILTHEDVSETAAEVKSRRHHNLKKLMASLEDQRYKLEERLIDLVSIGDSDGEIKKVRQKLRENEELRIGYFTELKTLSDEGVVISESTDQARKPRTVFVSSTYRDLVDHRAAVKDQIARRDMFFRGMEHFGAAPDHIAPAAKIVEEVRNANVYLGIFGVRYGSIDQATGLSMTELEFNEAEASGKPMLLYVIRDDATVKVSDVEHDPEATAKLDTFKARILRKHVIYMFSTVQDLARQVYEDIGKL